VAVQTGEPHRHNHDLGNDQQAEGGQRQQRFPAQLSQRGFFPFFLIMVLAQSLSINGLIRGHSIASLDFIIGLESVWYSFLTDHNNDPLVYPP
tara:strand:+ start:3594 stop:3872 length:279 start_codon:yes stop_codon:yes gene_type:complete